MLLHLFRLWAAEDEVRDLTNHLEISRENLKVLKQGYSQKLDELQKQLRDKSMELDTIKTQIHGNSN